MKMTRYQNDDGDATSWRRMKRCDNGGVGLWSDLNPDILFLVMMRLEFLDFSAFSKVCKPWRSLALANKNSFLVTRPPWSVSFSIDANKKECCYLEDFEGRKLNIIIPHSAGRECVGLACGYLILFGRKTKDFWLVNPITRHQLHFPNVRFVVKFSPYTGVRGVLVFSPSISRWLFVVIDRFSHGIWFSIAGKERWNYVSSTFPITDILAFKGKIYTLNFDYHRSGVGHLCEMRLDPQPKVTLLKTNNFPRRDIILSEFVNYGDNLYLVQCISEDEYKVHELDFGEMKWVCSEKKQEECAFFISHVYHSAAVKRESWWADTDKNQQGSRIYMGRMWYFPHECMNVITV